MAHPYTAYLTEAGQIDRAKVMTLAVRIARQERAASARAGMPVTWSQAMSYGLRKVWGLAISARNNVAATAAPVEVVDRASAIRRELEAVQFIDSTTAMQARRADLQAELSRIAA